MTKTLGDISTNLLLQQVRTLCEKLDKLMKDLDQQKQTIVQQESPTCASSDTIFQKFLQKNDNFCMESPNHDDLKYMMDPNNHVEFISC